MVPKGSRPYSQNPHSRTTNLNHTNPVNALTQRILKTTFKIIILFTLIDHWLSRDNSVIGVQLVPGCRSSMGFAVSYIHLSILEHI